jgi:phage tail-like protein
MSENYLLAAFHFRVLFKGLETAVETDSRFQSVTGLKATIETPGNPVATADEKKSTVTRFNPVVLRRAVERSNNSVLRRWVLENLNRSSHNEIPEVLIEVLNEEHKPEIIVRLKKVTAAGWQLGELNAANSELLMEEITLNYRSIEMVDV